MPRVDYTLSFENFLEMKNSSREMPRRYTGAVLSALLGFCLLVSGYSYLRAWPDRQPNVGGILVAVGFLATFLALSLAYLASPKTSRPDKATLRREYDLFHSDKRSMDFDENGWRTLWYEGEDIRPWSCVRVIRDLDTLLVISTQTTDYWWPKAALERGGQLAQVKSFAYAALRNRELLFTVPMRPSAVVYATAALFHNLRHKVKERLLSYVTVTIAAYWFVFADWDPRKSLSLWLLFLVPLLLILGEGLYYLQHYLVVDWSAAPREADIMSDCVGYKTDKIYWIAEYRRLMRRREVPGAFLLYFDPESFHLIPKKGFSNEQMRRFRELLAALPPPGATTRDKA